jgi:hypothetical protein
VNADTVEWLDWGYQNNYDDEIHEVAEVDGLAAFTFTREAYEATLDAAKFRIGQTALAE